MSRTVLLGVWAFGLVACSRIGFAVYPEVVDEAAAAAPSPDEGAADSMPAQDLGAADLGAADLGAADRGAADLGAVDPSTPFGPPTALGALNSAGDELGVSLTGDLLEIYFERDEDIWSAKRASATAAWGAPSLVAELSTSGYETSPRIGSDGLTITVSSNHGLPGASGRMDIYVATRPSRGDPWSALSPATELNSGANDCCAMVAPDGRTVVFASDRGASYDLYMATRSSSATPWSAVVPLSHVNSGATDCDPWLDPTGTVLYFDSARDMRSAWGAVRGSAADPFSAPWQLEELTDVQDVWLSEDLRTIFFSSLRAGSWDLYTATR